MIDTLKIYNELSQTMDASAAKKIAEIIGLVYTELQNIVTKVEFNELKGIVKDLVEAQKRTETRIEELTTAQKELAEAQKKTETRIEELTEAQKKTETRMEELAEAQKKTEIRVKELTEAQKKTETRVEELAEAQKKTEIRVKELTEAQKKTETRVEELTEAQKKTETRLEELANGQRELATAQKKTEIELKSLTKIVGGLSNTLGFELEEKYYDIFPRIIGEDFQVKTTIPFDRRYFTYPSGRDDEINIYSEGTRNGEKIYIIGESKAQIGKNDVKDFAKIIQRVNAYLKKELITIFLCYTIHPRVEQFIQETYPSIKVYKSSELSRRAKANTPH